MLALTEKNIRLGCRAGTTEEAIRQAGSLLNRCGFAGPAYTEGMLEREQLTSTYLDNGIAIPHGREETIKEVIRTGMCVLQYPGGVPWGNEQTVYLAVGIAAVSDDHINILQNVAEIAEDPELAGRLAQTDDVELMLRHFNSFSENDD